MSANASSTSGVDWTWETTPVMGAALVAGGAYSVAAVGAAAGLPPMYAGLVAGSGAVAQAVSDLRRRRPAAHTLARAAAWLGSGVWTAATVASDAAFTANAFGWWSAGATAGLVLANGLAHSEQSAREGKAAALIQRWANGMSAEWHQRLATLFRLEGHRVPGVKPWPDDVGYTVMVELPPGTHELPSNAARILAGALKLPRGGGVDVTEGNEHGSVLIRVTLVDVMATEIPFPDDLDVTTINNPISIGKHPDGAPVQFSVLDSCGHVVGQTDSGKTNVTHVINGKVLKANDVLVWHIDTTGAGLSLPWLRAWALDGTAERPVIDYVASTEEEAHIMLDIAIAGMSARKTGYQDLMASVDDDKIPVSPQVPEILIIADEIAELSMPLLDKLNTIINVGRATRFREISIGLRATQDVSTPAMKKQSRIRIGMRVSDPEELSHLFPYGGARLDPRAARVQGSGFVSYPDATGTVIQPRPYKAERLVPSRINTLAVALADRRPTMDAVTVDTDPGRYYASRWARVLPQLFKGKTLAATTDAWTKVEVLRPPLNERGIPDTGAAPFDDTASGRSARRSPHKVGAAEMAALMNAARERLDDAPRRSDPDDEVDAFGAVLANTGPTQWGTARPTEPREPAVGPSVPELLVRAHRALEEAGGRMYTADLADALDMDAQTLGNELNALMRAVGVSRSGTGSIRVNGGSPRSGYLAETLADAIGNYRA